MKHAAFFVLAFPVGASAPCSDPDWADRANAEDEARALRGCLAVIARGGAGVRFAAMIPRR